MVERFLLDLLSVCTGQDGRGHWDNQRMAGQLRIGLQSKTRQIASNERFAKSGSLEEQGEASITTFVNSLPVTGNCCAAMPLQQISRWRCLHQL